MRVAVGSFLLLAFSSPAIAAAPALSPTGRWIVNFAESQCLASRNYGSLDKPLLLVLKQPPLGDVMQLAVIRTGAGSGRFGREVNAEIGVDSARPVERTMIGFHVKSGNQRVLLINLPLTEFAAVRAARTLTVDAGSELNQTFQLAGIAPLMKVMDECVADLRKVWNIDSGASPSPVRQGAIGNLQGLIEADDYPDVAIRGLKQGTVQFALLIDEQGKVADCTVTQTSGAASLDAQSCAIVSERARFKPAIGVDGKPAKGSWLQRITWRME